MAGITELPQPSNPHNGDPASSPENLHELPTEPDAETKATFDGVAPRQSTVTRPNHNDDRLYSSYAELRSLH